MKKLLAVAAITTALGALPGRADAVLCVANGYIERVQVFAGNVNSTIYVRSPGAIGTALFTTTTINLRFTDAALQALTHRNLVAIQGTGLAVCPPAAGGNIGTTNNIKVTP